MPAYEEHLARLNGIVYGFRAIWRDLKDKPAEAKTLMDAWEQAVADIRALGYSEGEAIRRLRAV